GTEYGPLEMIERALELVDPPLVRDHHQQSRKDCPGGGMRVVLAEHQETVEVPGLLDARDHRRHLPDAIVGKWDRGGIFAGVPAVSLLRAREHSEDPRLAPYRAHPCTYVHSQRRRRRIRTVFPVAAPLHEPHRGVRIAPLPRRGVHRRSGKWHFSPALPRLGRPPPVARQHDLRVQAQRAPHRVPNDHVDVPPHPPRAHALLVPQAVRSLLRPEPFDLLEGVDYEDASDDRAETTRRN
ncbi:hypothetical protein THAOC_17080, partial [Thalassiosira oceanica]